MRVTPEVALPAFRLLAAIGLQLELSRIIPALL